MNLESLQRGLATCVLLLGLTTLLPAQAAPVAAITSFTGGGLNGNGLDLPRTVGWTFRTNTNMTVLSLGLWDQEQDGLISAHRVGLWSSTGVLLASTTIQAGTASALDGEFRYESIAALALGAGSYVIGADFANDSDRYIFAPNSVTTAGDVSFGNGVRSDAGSGFQFPSLEMNSGRIGPNFRFESASVPEPSTLALSVFVLLGLAVSRRNIKQ